MRKALIWLSLGLMLAMAAGSLPARADVLSDKQQELKDIQKKIDAQEELLAKIRKQKLTLDTQMKICRGSGVLEKIGGKWKIRQYVLSMTVPNEVVNEVVKVKTPIEDSVLQTLKNK